MSVKKCNKDDVIGKQRLNTIGSKTRNTSKTTVNKINRHRLKANTPR